MIVHFLKRGSLTLALLLFVSGCASHVYRSNSGHRAYARGNYEEAIVEFSKASKNAGSNLLLFKLDLAMSHFAKRDYRTAIEIFLQAEKLAEIKDYTSVSEEVGVLVSGENIRGYKGEDFEKVLINVYLALSFAALGELEDARVECRKINLLLRRMIDEGKRKYQESAFARYLSATLWEASGEWNSAYIDYKKAYELDSNLPGLAADLIYTANRAGLYSAERKHRIEHPGAKIKRPRRNHGELMVFFERGQSPAKTPRYGEETLPMFRSRYGGSSVAVLFVDGEPYSEFVEFLNIDKTSKEFLEDRIGRMRAAQLLRVATKAALASAVAGASKDEDAGWLAFWLLMSTDQADLRSWLSLPKAIDIFRMELPAGKHHVRMEISSVHEDSVREIDFGEVEIKARNKIFLMGR